MKRIISLIFLLGILAGCTTFKEVVIIDNEGNEIYRDEGYITATPDFESPTFNIKVKNEDGEETVFFGSLSGYVLDTKAR